jgi:hypothetical protein
MNAAQIGAYFDVNNVVQGYISQTLSTVVGQEYTISFLYGEYNSNPSFGGTDGSCCYLDPTNITDSNDPSTSPWAQNDSLNVLFGGDSVFSATNFFTSANPDPTTNPNSGESIGDYFYLQGTASVNATSTSTTLEFDANDYQQGVIITDISAVASPEPGTLGLLGSALLALGLAVRRKRALL